MIGEIRYQQANEIHRAQVFHSLLRCEITQSIAFGQQQTTTVLDRDLRYLGKALQQPRQRHLQPDVVVLNIEVTRGGLPERAYPEDHAIVLPSFLVDLQHRNAGGGARQPGLEATRRLLAAKAMRDGNDKRGGHRKSSFDPTSCSSIAFERKRLSNYGDAKSGTSDVLASCTG
jgi:hypothetical protein